MKKRLSIIKTRHPLPPKPGRAHGAPGGDKSYSRLKSKKMFKKEKENISLPQLPKPSRKSEGFIFWFS